MDDFLYRFQSLPQPCIPLVTNSCRVKCDESMSPCIKANRFRAEEPSLCLDFVRNCDILSLDVLRRRTMANTKTKKHSTNFRCIKEKDNCYLDMSNLHKGQYVYASKPTILQFSNGFNDTTNSTTVSPVQPIETLPRQLPVRKPPVGGCPSRPMLRRNDLLINSYAHSVRQGIKDANVVTATTFQRPLLLEGCTEQMSRAFVENTAKSDSDRSLFASFVRQKEEEEQALLLYQQFLEKQAYEEDNSAISDNLEMFSASQLKLDSFKDLPTLGLPSESVLNFSNPSELVDILSPPITLTSILPTKQRPGAEERLCLMFDADLNKYFNPSSGKYYELE